MKEDRHAQPLNLLNLTARKVYTVHFDKPDAFLAASAPTQHFGKTHKKAEPLLGFAWRHHFEIDALFRAASRTPS